MAASLALLLGFAPKLAKEEIRCVTGIEPVYSNDRVVILPNAPLDPKQLQSRLGGSIKTVRILHQLADDSQRTLENAIVDQMQPAQTTQTIGLAEWGRDHLPSYSLSDIKRAVQAAGFRVRFREGGRWGLPGSVLSHHPVTEFVVLYWDEQWWLGKTEGWSDPDYWATRDRIKPFAEHKRGMLPPKVARMLVNIGLAQSKEDSTTVIDPFCGSGTILMEARSCRQAALGGDSDATAVAGSLENLEWQTVIEPSVSPYQYAVFHTDAASFTPQQQLKNCVVVTEPFLGKPKPQPDQINNMVRGLSKLYWGSLRQWSTWLPDGTSVIMIWPSFGQAIEKEFSQVIDKLTGIGYSITSGPWEYGQPDAVVKRRIYRLEFKRK